MSLPLPPEGSLIDPAPTNPTGFYVMFHDKCGVLGVWNSSIAIQSIYFGLYALQHRGEESAGFAVSDGKEITSSKSMGKVDQLFNSSVFKSYRGKNALGHTRYSTTGENHYRNAQPLVKTVHKTPMAIVHNGQITNFSLLKSQFQKEGAIFQSSSDTEIFFHLLEQENPFDFPSSFLDALVQMEGAFSMVLLYQDKLIGLRDPHGFRPLCLGQKDDSYILASETCALDLMEAKYIRHIDPGEVVVIDKNGIQSFFPFSFQKEKFCIFELIYFSRPDSSYGGRGVLEFRKALGRQLAKEAPCPKGDLVISIPDSSYSSALGYSEETQVPFEFGLIKNHYVGRTFIEPIQENRAFQGRIKYNPVKSIVQGKSLIVIDDSIVRGTTSYYLTSLLKKAGAKEVHLRVSSPIIHHPCYYGIDTPNQKDLIGYQCKTEKKIQKKIEADSLQYLSLDGLSKVYREMMKKNSFCHACFTGDYPVIPPSIQSSNQQEKMVQM